MCVWARWHSTEWTDVWIRQRSAHFKFILNTHAHILVSSEDCEPTKLKANIAKTAWPETWASTIAGVMGQGKATQ